MSSSSSKSKVSLFIATPAYGSQVYTSYVFSLIKLMELCQSKGITINYYTVSNESLIPRGRNTACYEYLRTRDYTHMLFLDADIEFEAEDIIKLIEADKSVIGGSYPKKSLQFNHIANFINQNKDLHYTEEILRAFREPTSIYFNKEDACKTGIVECRYVATGILLLKRHVFDDIMSKYPEDFYDYEGQKHFRFFDTELKYGSYLSEDYFFCETWMLLGGKSYIMNDFRCKHYGINAF